MRQAFRTTLERSCYSRKDAPGDSAIDDGVLVLLPEGEDHRVQVVARPVLIGVVQDDVRVSLVNVEALCDVKRGMTRYARDMSREEDLTSWLIEAINPISAELLERLEADLSESDLTAVLTAVQKAAIAGVRQGVAVLASAEPERLSVTWSGNADHDEWAERFGQAE